MSYEDDFPTDITSYRIKLSNGEELWCTKYNTTLYFFDGVLEIMNHIYTLRSNGEPLYLFNSSEQMEEMSELGFDQYYSSVPPSEYDQKVFYLWAGRRMMRQVEYYLKDK